MRKILKRKKKWQLQQRKPPLSSPQNLAKPTNIDIENSLDMNTEESQPEQVAATATLGNSNPATPTTQTTQLQTTNSTSKEKTRSMMNLSEVSVIRDILMGQQMADYERRFNSMETLIEAKDEATRHRINALEGELKAELVARFEKLEHLLLLNVEQLNQRMQSLSRQDKNSLSELLIAMSQKLKE